jgi:hypothetical protein
MHRNPVYIKIKNPRAEPDVVYMPIIPATLETENRIVVGGQPRNKVSKTLSQTISQVWWYLCVIPALRRLRQVKQVFKASLD